MIAHEWLKKYLLENLTSALPQAGVMPLRKRNTLIQFNKSYLLLRSS